ncbi:hypothetical protein MXZ18_02705 [Streptococcus uberis]|nr:hypothetical protein [Streptococcus uberis]MCK1159158.1 hypothetical protein [Streptococcus uberis]MCK1168573.1 hypothetical protein [Streptococcus uberis]MCK1234770.1 hypothetical protein [Streptococcus uberis]MCK1252704.1 hypothetical protein [Streptococcus uberis]
MGTDTDSKPLVACPNEDATSSANTEGVKTVDNNRAPKVKPKIGFTDF